MKILVASDYHSKKQIFNKLVSKNKPDYIFFLGDGLSDFNEEVNFDEDKIFSVKGNCDTDADIDTTKTFKLGKVIFLLTHGHGFNVKNGLEELFEYAKREEVDFVCFGHTHKIFEESINNIKFFNPGSLASESADYNSYGILEIEGKKITQKIEKI
jgi:putative phosphoesterase